MASEFSLIARYFTRATPSAVLGVGDDAALLHPRAGHELVVSTDMLVEGTHFLPGTDACDLGWKTLAVNLSDMAAMGAAPRWATLALALPAARDDWLAAFADGFFACAETFGVELIGGDTTRGPLSLSVTILGEVPAGQALRRDGAHVGDDIWVSGEPGRAALGLAHLQGKRTLDEPLRSECLAALQRPQPRVALGLALRDVASAAIDVSDGLLADLGHILERSRLSATLQCAVPQGLTFASYFSGGDDYELVFTAAPTQRDRLATLASTLNLPLTRIGQTVALVPGTAPDVRVLDATGKDITPPQRGFDHFR